MYVVGSQIAVVNCTFTENVAGYTFTNQYGFPASCPGKGGGMFVKNHLCAGVGSVDLVDCRFTDNQAIGGGWGGAVYNFGNAQMQAMIRATNCLFADNQADPLVYSYEEEWYITQAKAGAICNQFGQVQLINCTVADNTAGEWQCKGQGTGYCGGIYSAGAPTPLADLDLSLIHI